MAGLKERFGEKPKEFMDEYRQTLRDQRAVKEALKQGPATVPKIAQVTGLQPPRVLWLVAALKKYGEVVECGEDSSYPLYALKESEK